MQKSIINHIKLLEVDSTNRYLSNLLQEDANLPNYTVVTAQRQYSGRGQRGNSWESEDDKNLIFSMLLRPDNLSIRDNFVISQIISLSIKYALNNYTDGITIKWPNDIYYNDKKIAGILIENRLCDTLIDTSIVGVGLNVNQTHFVSDAPNPISLKQIIGEDSDISTLFDSILDNIFKLEAHYRATGIAGINACYTDSLYRSNGFFNFIEAGSSVPFEAKIDGINSLGHITLTDRGGVSKSYQFKEVAFVIDKGAN